MQIKLVSLALFGLAAAVAIEPLPATTTTTRCNADNCARALTGIQDGTTRSAFRVSECSQYQTATLVPAVTMTTTRTGTVPAFATTACTSNAAGNPSQRYASACSCAGVTSGSPVLTSVATPAATPTSFKIAVKDTNGLFSIAGLNTDTQSYGNTGDQVLSVVGTQLFFQLVGTVLKTTEITPRSAYAFPGSASKFYFSTSTPMAEGMTYGLFSCALGNFDGTVPGYPLTCTNLQGQTSLIRQAQGNYGIAQPGFQEEGTVPGGQLYAVQ